MFKKIVKKKVFYKEGQIVLTDDSVFHFKSFEKCWGDNYFVEIIDLYDNLVKIPYRQIKYVFYHANNQLNAGGKQLG